MFLFFLCVKVRWKTVCSSMRSDGRDNPQPICTEQFWLEIFKLLYIPPARWFKNLPVDYHFKDNYVPMGILIFSFRYTPDVGAVQFFYPSWLEKSIMIISNAIEFVEQVHSPFPTFTISACAL